MRRARIRYLLYGQYCLYGGILVCIFLKPAGLETNSGLSYYGIYAQTVVPYMFALLGAAVFSLTAARTMTRVADRYIRFGLVCFAVLLVGISLTPYSVGEPINLLHTTFGSALFSLQLILTGWLAFWRRRNITTVGLWLIEFLAGIASAAYLNPSHGYLLESQLLFQLAFGTLLIYVLSEPSSTRSPKNV